eukprot:1844240-Prymnesium_polylepis.1
MQYVLACEPRGLFVETPAFCKMAKGKRKAAPTPAAAPAAAGADSPASRAMTARKRSRLGDPALEDGADGLAPVDTAIEPLQDAE